MEGLNAEFEKENFENNAEFNKSIWNSMFGDYKASVFTENELNLFAEMKNERNTKSKGKSQSNPLKMDTSAVEYHNQAGNILYRGEKLQGIASLIAMKNHGSNIKKRQDELNSKIKERQSTLDILKIDVEKTKKQLEIQKNCLLTNNVYYKLCRHLTRLIDEKLKEDKLIDARTKANLIKDVINNEFDNLENIKAHESILTQLLDSFADIIKEEINLYKQSDKDGYLNTTLIRIFNREVEPTDREIQKAFVDHFFKLDQNISTLETQLRIIKENKNKLYMEEDIFNRQSKAIMSTIELFWQTINSGDNKESEVKDIFTNDDKFSEFIKNVLEQTDNVDYVPNLFGSYSSSDNGVIDEKDFGWIKTIINYCLNKKDLAVNFDPESNENYGVIFSKIKTGYSNFSDACSNVEKLLVKVDNDCKSIENDLEEAKTYKNEICAINEKLSNVFEKADQVINDNKSQIMELVYKTWPNIELDNGTQIFYPPSLGDKNIGQSAIFDLISAFLNDEDEYKHNFQSALDKVNKYFLGDNYLESGSEIKYDDVEKLANQLNNLSFNSSKSKSTPTGDFASRYFNFLGSRQVEGHFQKFIEGFNHLDRKVNESLLAKFPNLQKVSGETLRKHGESISEKQKILEVKALEINGTISELAIRLSKLKNLKARLNKCELDRETINKFISKYDSEIAKIEKKTELLSNELQTIDSLLQPVEQQFEKLAPDVIFSVINERFNSRSENGVISTIFTDIRKLCGISRQTPEELSKLDRSFSQRLAGLLSIDESKTVDSMEKSMDEAIKGKLHELTMATSSENLEKIKIMIKEASSLKPERSVIDAEKNEYRNLLKKQDLLIMLNELNLSFNRIECNSLKQNMLKVKNKAAKVKNSSVLEENLNVLQANIDKFEGSGNRIREEYDGLKREIEGLNLNVEGASEKLDTFNESLIILATEHQKLCKQKLVLEFSINKRLEKVESAWQEHITEKISGIQQSAQNISFSSKIADLNKSLLIFKNLHESNSFISNDVSSDGIRSNISRIIFYKQLVNSVVQESRIEYRKMYKESIARTTNQDNVELPKDHDLVNPQNWNNLGNLFGEHNVNKEKFEALCALNQQVPFSAILDCLALPQNISCLPMIKEITFMGRDKNLLEIIQKGHDNFNILVCELNIALSNLQNFQRECQEILENTDQGSTQWTAINESLVNIEAIIKDIQDGINELRGDIALIVRNDLFDEQIKIYAESLFDIINKADVLDQSVADAWELVTSFTDTNNTHMVSSVNLPSCSNDRAVPIKSVRSVRVAQALAGTFIDSVLNQDYTENLDGAGSDRPQMVAKTQNVAINKTNSSNSVKYVDRIVGSLNYGFDQEVNGLIEYIVDHHSESMIKFEEDTISFPPHHSRNQSISAAKAMDTFKIAAGGVASGFVSWFDEKAGEEAKKAIGATVEIKKDRLDGFFSQVRYGFSIIDRMTKQIVPNNFWDKNSTMHATLSVFRHLLLIGANSEQVATLNSYLTDGYRSEDKHALALKEFLKIAHEVINSLNSEENSSKEVTEKLSIISTLLGKPIANFRNEYRGYLLDFVKLVSEYTQLFPDSTSGTNYTLYNQEKLKDILSDEKVKSPIEKIDKIRFKGGEIKKNRETYLENTLYLIVGLLGELKTSLHKEDSLPDYIKRCGDDIQSSFMLLNQLLQCCSSRFKGVDDGDPIIIENLDALQQYLVSTTSSNLESLNIDIIKNMLYIFSNLLSNTSVMNVLVEELEIDKDKCNYNLGLINSSCMILQEVINLYEHSDALNKLDPSICLGSRVNNTAKNEEKQKIFRGLFVSEDLGKENNNISNRIYYIFQLISLNLDNASIDQKNIKEHLLNNIIGDLLPESKGDSLKQEMIQKMVNDLSSKEDQVRAKCFKEIMLIIFSQIIPAEEIDEILSLNFSNNKMDFKICLKVLNSIIIWGIKKQSISEKDIRLMLSNFTERTKKFWISKFIPDASIDQFQSMFNLGKFRAFVAYFNSTLGRSEQISSPDCSGLVDVLENFFKFILEKTFIDIRDINVVKGLETVKTSEIRKSIEEETARFTLAGDFAKFADASTAATATVLPQIQKQAQQAYEKKETGSQLLMRNNFLEAQIA
ncbi:MAG: hypothetical protein ACK5Z5_00605 [Neisseriaceae bacterium]